MQQSLIANLWPGMRKPGLGSTQNTPLYITLIISPSVYAIQGL